MIFDELTEQQVIDLAYDVFATGRHQLNLGDVRKEVVERKLGRKIDDRLNDDHVFEAFETCEDFDKEVKARINLKIDNFIEQSVNAEKTYCATVEQDLIKMGVDKSISDKFGEKFDMLHGCMDNDNIDLFKKTAKFIITGN